MARLHLADDLALPVDALTRAIAIVGQRGTGKTSTAVVLSEEAVAAGAQLVVIDPTGAWYGLRSSADGKDAGLPVIVLGGHHGDVPLEKEHGALVADLVVKEGYSVVIDLELLTKSAQLQFVADFAERLYHTNRDALLLVIDEAHRFTPQVLREPGGYGARCVGALGDVVTLGRRKGLGCAFVSQRPAKIHKDVFEQAEIMVAHRLMGPNDIKALKGWLEDVGEDDKSDEMLDALRRLRQGEAVVYAPELGVFDRFKVRPKRTFDSSATPEVGARRREPVARSEVDLSALQERMSTVIERQKADDPKELRRQLGEARKRISELESRPTETEVVERVVVPEGAENLASHASSSVAGAAAALTDAASTLDELLRDFSELRAHPQAAGPPRPGRGVEEERHPGSGAGRREAVRLQAAARGGPPPAQPQGEGSESNGRLSRSQQAILDSLAVLTRIGQDRPGRTQVALFARVSPKSSGFEKNLSTLRTQGYIDYPGQGTVVLLGKGEAVANADSAPRTAAEMQTFVRGLVGEARWRVLDPLIQMYPGDITRDDLAPYAGVSANSSGFEKNLSTLRSLGLIDYPRRGYVVAQPVLLLGAVDGA